MGLFFRPTHVFAQSCSDGTIECGLLVYTCEADSTNDCSDVTKTNACNKMWISSLGRYAECVIDDTKCNPSAQVRHQVPCSYVSGQCKPPDSEVKACNAVGMCLYVSLGCTLSCTWTAWTDGACDDGDCTPTQRRQYRTVDPPGCTNSTQCVDDDTCAASTPTPTSGATPTPWIRVVVKNSSLVNVPVTEACKIYCSNSACTKSAPPVCSANIADFTFPRGTTNATYPDRGGTVLL